MIYVEILAGGKGERMNNVEIPKQFLKIGSKPIIIHTIEKFIQFDEINKILVLVPENWLNFTRDLIVTNLKDEEKIVLITGGTTRNETIMKGIKHIQDNFGLNDDDIVITHDAVRPFVSYRIIKENIKYVKEYGATDTIVPAIDTIVKSIDGNLITEIPKREEMYQGQTPQSFIIKDLLDAYSKLTDMQKNILTDAAKIMVLDNRPVKIVEGDYFNIKITTQYDLLVANSILEGAKTNVK